MTCELLAMESDRRMLKKCEECIRRYRIHRVFEKLDVNRRIQKQYKKSMNVAKQFHTFVVLSKYFETWHADTKRRRALICFYRNTLRKILLKWRCYAEEQNNRRKSCMIISETLTKIQFRKLQHILHVLSTHCWRYHVLKKVFREWRSIVTKHTMWQINMLLRFEDSQRRMILHHWNDAVQRRIWCRWRNYQRLKKVIKAWKKITDESIITWELQLQKADSYCEERLFHLVGRIFEHMVCVNICMVIFSAFLPLSFVINCFEIFSSCVASCGRNFFSENSGREEESHEKSICHGEEKAYGISNEDNTEVLERILRVSKEER